ncbi:MAG: NAD(P)/FAD-dependent oxidoreductase [Candidatus Omnitrophica bacterium]|nr:NAD(P)/FAD-dependent oxidoreductase [Candidatus Omnitrophota bacterium]
MSKDVTVIGAGNAGISFVRRLREKDSSAKIVLIDKNSFYYDKHAFINSLQIKEKMDLDSWCLQNNVTFINGTVDKVSVRKSKIYFKKRELISFKNLVLASGLVSKKLSLKGENKEGTFYLDNIDPGPVLKLLKLSPDVTVYIKTFIGCKLALSLKAIGKEVRVVSDNNDFFNDSQISLGALLEERGILFYDNTFISEIIGESMVKAVKINPLKVFPSQLVFIDSGFSANSDLFEEEVELRGSFKTNHENLLMAGSVTRDELDLIGNTTGLNDSQESKRAGICLADFFLAEKSADFTRILLNLEQKRDIIKEIFKKCPVIKEVNSQIDESGTPVFQAEQEVRGQFRLEASQDSFTGPDTQREEKKQQSNNEDKDASDSQDKYLLPEKDNELQDKKEVL